MIMMKRIILIVMEVNSSNSLKKKDIHSKMNHQLVEWVEEITIWEVKELLEQVIYIDKILKDNILLINLNLNFSK